MRAQIEELREHKDKERKKERSRSRSNSGGKERKKERKNILDHDVASHCATAKSKFVCSKKSTDGVTGQPRLFRSSWCRSAIFIRE